MMRLYKYAVERVVAAAGNELAVTEAGALAGIPWRRSGERDVERVRPMVVLEYVEASREEQRDGAGSVHVMTGGMLRVLLLLNAHEVTEEGEESLSEELYERMEGLLYSEAVLTELATETGLTVRDVRESVASVVEDAAVTDGRVVELGWSLIFHGARSL